MGAWAANSPGGIRNYIYSLVCIYPRACSRFHSDLNFRFQQNDTVNPSTYKTLDKPGYWGVHAVGEVWAEILWVVSNGLIKDHGYSKTLFPPQPTADGVVPVGDFYRPNAGKKPLVPKHGNTLAIQ